MAQPENKPRVFKFASLNALMKFDNADPTCENMNFSVTVSGPSKTQFQVWNRNTNSGVQFSFYNIDILPWVKGCIAEIKAGGDDPVVHREIAGGVPEFARKPGKPTTGSFVISSDDAGPFIQLTVDTASLPKWRFKPIPNTIFLEGTTKKEFSDNHRMVAWLEMLLGKVTLVSDYIAAIEARQWTPPIQGEIEIKPSAPIEGNAKDTVKDQYDDDIPF